MSPVRTALFSRLNWKASAETVPTVHIVRACRDPKDDKFLEVALNGTADAIVTGDADLLEMHPWRGIEVVTPADI
jgi:putative PIN family toxin of toxin-antitoxin system